MLFVENDLKFYYATTTGTGGALMSFKNILVSSSDPGELLATFEKATAALRLVIDKQTAETEPVAEDDEPVQPGEPVSITTRQSRSLDIEDVNVGDQIRVGGWWHRVAEIHERRHGYTVKTTRNEWFGFDHGDRITVANGGDND